MISRKPPHKVIVRVLEDRRSKSTGENYILIAVYIKRKDAVPLCKGIPRPVSTCGVASHLDHPDDYGPLDLPAVLIHILIAALLEYLGLNLRVFLFGHK